MMEQARKQKLELSKVSSSGSSTNTKLTKVQHLLKQSEISVEKLQEQFRNGLKTSSMSLTTHLNDKGNQDRVFSVLSSNDIFNEMVAGGQFAVEKEVQDYADQTRHECKKLIQGVWRVIQTLVLGPLGRSKDPIALELRAIVPNFNFDTQLLDYELPQHNVEQATTALLDILKTVFQEFVTVP